MNLAAAKDLPVVFVCENNKYSELTPIDTMVRNPNLAARAEALGIPAVRVDGNDPAEVAAAAAVAVQAARQGTGPTFLEASTRRIVGHYIGDVQHYRPEGELERDTAREPILRLKRVLVASGVPEQTIDAVERRARAEIAAAAEEALAAPGADVARVKEHLHG
jgi:TPP-dependent pyruvate/acetoin dehydrogenase alpha subunit